MLLDELVTTSDTVAATRSRLAKVDALAALLVRLESDEIAPAIGFLVGRPRQGRVGVGWRTVSSVMGNSTLRGMVSLFLGLAIGLIGIDQISGQARYTLGVAELVDGIEVVLVAVGLFAVAEALFAVLYEGRRVETRNAMTSVMMTMQEWRRSFGAWMRGTLIGFSRFQPFSSHVRNWSSNSYVHP